MRCRVFTESGDSYIHSSNYYHPEKIRFSETEEQTNNVTYFTLEKLTGTSTRLTIDVYRKKSFITQFLPVLAGANKLKGNYQRSMEKLEKLVAEL